MIKHLKIKIYGEVQGVTFRFRARDLAKKLGLVGYAQNLPDDSIYIEAEGEEENLQKFLAWCQRGPSYAKVDKVEEEWSDQLENYSEFEIKF